MKQYLLDTNICIYLFKGLYDLSEKIEAIGTVNFFISEITVAELKFGAANSDFPERNAKKINQLQQQFTYDKRKIKLKRKLASN